MEKSEIDVNDLPPHTLNKKTFKNKYQLFKSQVKPEEKNIKSLRKCKDSMSLKIFHKKVLASIFKIWYFKPKA